MYFQLILLQLPVHSTFIVVSLIDTVRAIHQSESHSDGQLPSVPGQYGCTAYRVSDPGDGPICA